MDDFEQGPRQDQPLSPGPLKPQPLKGKGRDRKGREKGSILKRFARFFFVLMIIATVGVLGFIIIPIAGFFGVFLFGAIHFSVVAFATIVTVGVVWLMEPFRGYAAWGFEVCGKIADFAQSMDKIIGVFPYLIYSALGAAVLSIFFAALAQSIKHDKGCVKYYITCGIFILIVGVIFLLFVANGGKFFIN